MFDKLEIFKMAQGMATHAAARQSVLSQNIANADTPGYRAKDVAAFADIYREAPKTGSLRQTRDGHLSSSTTDSVSAQFAVEASVAPNGNSVSLEEEMVKAAETKGQHDTALAIYKSALGIMRSSIGK